VSADTFLVVVTAASVLAGATAAVAGFGIGSLLTPLIALRFETSIAVALVALPHAAATTLRAWRLRDAVDWKVFRQFGIWSAVGGVAGALLFARLSSPALTRILGALLLLTAISGLSAWAQRVRLPPWAAWMLGVLSGFFGGIVGNQGGLRAGALLGLGLAPAAFVATSTMSGVIVDIARTPVYVARQGDAIVAAWQLVLLATAGTLVGTVLGEKVLLGLSPGRFRQLIAVLIGALGIWLLTQRAG
jgi:uncharacterized protein